MVSGKGELASGNKKLLHAVIKKMDLFVFVKLQI
jgi:hypothetical protein